MITRFLQAKHWQLFLLTIGIPMILQLVLIGRATNSALNGTGPSATTTTAFFIVFPLLMILLTGTLGGWFWSIAVGLDEVIPEHLRLKLSRFKLLLLFPAAYLLLTMAMVSSRAFIKISLFEELPKPLLTSVVILWMLLHLFTMFCVAHSMYFVAKTIKIAETQRVASFGDFMGEFFLIWFYPVGIWFLQPRINKLAGNNSRNEGLQTSIKK